MTIQTDTNMTVRDFIVQHPRSRPVLESYGIDYCCGGQRPLAEATADAEVDLARLLQDVEAKERESEADPGDRSWDDAGLVELVDHIEERHHTYMKSTLPRLGDLFTKVINAHGEAHGEMLKGLRDVYSDLREEIEMHLMKEEQILFPYVREMEKSVDQKCEAPPMHCGSVENPVRQMEVEHDNAGAALEKMRSISNDYTLPDDACPTFQTLYEVLQEMEQDLHQHIHLENNILFPRAIEMQDRHSSQ